MKFENRWLWSLVLVLSGWGWAGAQTASTPDACGPFLPPSQGRPSRGASQGLAAELVAGETDRYALSLPKNRFAEIRLVELKANLILSVQATNASTGQGTDTPGPYRGIESVTWKTDREAQTLCIQVQGRTPREEGAYRIEVDVRRARPRDALLVQADRDLARAHHLQRQASSRRRSIESYQRALKAYRELSRIDRQALTLHQIARTRMLLKEYPEALEPLREARALHRSLHNSVGEAAALNMMGRCFRKLARDDDAIRTYLRALDLWRRGGSPAQEAVTYTNLAAVFEGQGRLNEAREHLSQALKAFREAGDESNQAVALNNLGRVEQLLGDPLSAERRYHQALDMTTDKGTRAWLHNNLGLLFSRMGQKQAALDQYGQALDQADRRGDSPLKIRLLNNRGSLYLQLALPEKALSEFDQAAALLSDSRSLKLKASTLNNRGRALEALDQTEEAGRDYQQALALARQAKDSVRTATILGNIGGLELAQGRSQEALQRLSEALRLRRLSADRLNQSRTLRKIGRAYAALGQNEAAEDHLRRALALATELRDEEDQVKILQEMASLALSTGDEEGALSYLRTAIERVESLRLQIDGDHLRTAYFSSLRRVYRLFADVSMRLGRSGGGGVAVQEAFLASERARSRGLIDLLRAAQVEGTLDFALAGRRRGLSLMINADVERLARAGLTPDQSRQIERRLDRHLSSLDQIMATLRVIEPRYAELYQPPAPRLEGIQKQLDEGTLVLEYFLGIEGAYLWAVTRTSFEGFELGSPESIETLAREAHDDLKQPDPASAARLRRTLEQLSQSLLQPVADHLAGRRLVIVADGALHYLPFAVLPYPQTGDGKGEPTAPLIATNQVLSIPSASVLEEWRRLRPASGGRPRLTIIADPIFGPDDPRLTRLPTSSADAVERSGPVVDQRLTRLEWSRREAESIAAQAGDWEVGLWLGAQANLRTVSAAPFAASRVVHLATHGVLDDRKPELSSLVFSLFDGQGKPQPGHLRLHDIYRMRLQADLVVLSGCQTALGQQVRGEGLIGMTRGFLFAGASQVMASLWSVRERSTAELMGHFYRFLLQEERPPAEALRLAQLQMRQDRDRRHPYYWAPFVIQGDWRNR